jgi:hypothetical protein
MPINRKIFFDGIRQQPFNGKLDAGQVSGTTAILDEWERRKLSDLRHLAYMLGTTNWETAHTMQPITERGGAAYLRSKKYFPWVGRGYVQLTWQRNYQAMTDLMRKADFKSSAGSIDLIANPELALVPDIAAFVMFEGMIRGTFTGKKLSDYFNDTKTDWLNARRIINGVDKASEIAAIGKMFYADLVAS